MLSMLGGKRNFSLKFIFIYGIYGSNVLVFIFICILFMVERRVQTISNYELFLQLATPSWVIVSIVSFSSLISPFFQFSYSINFHQIVFSSFFLHLFLFKQNKCSPSDTHDTHPINKVGIIKLRNQNYSVINGGQTN